MEPLPSLSYLLNTRCDRGGGGPARAIAGNERQNACTGQGDLFVAICWGVRERDVPAGGRRVARLVFCGSNALMDSKHKFGDDPTLEEPSLSSDKSRRSSLTEGKRGYRASFSSNAPRMPDLPGGDFLGLDADSVSTASTAQDADDYGPQDALME